jgi:DNA repair protein RecN (Recombination protein N)
LQPIVGFGDTYQQLYDRIESMRIELNDIAGEVEKEEERIEFDPAETERIKERLSTLYQLLQKHRQREVSGLLNLQASLQEKADKTTNLDESLVHAKKAMESARVEVETSGEKLSQSRQKVFASLTKKLVKLLHELGIPDAQLLVDHHVQPAGPNGIDIIELLFSANKGIAPRPLAQVASGGEFSRLMFAIKYVMAEKSALPTLILDEIDTGVSGEISIQLGRLMKEMATRHQLIAISHLPQIAAKADTHYFVYKDNSSAKTTSMVRLLNDQERVQEIAKMIGGASPSVKAIENARELIEN